MLSQRPTENDLEASVIPQANTFARRSASIFSRRGGVESVDFSQIPAMRGFSFGPGTRVSTQRSKPENKSKKSKDTILNAVPHTAHLPQLSPSIYTPPPRPASPLGYPRTITSVEQTIFREKQEKTTMGRRQTRHAPTKSSVERIGTWVDGIVQWDVAKETRSSEDLAYDVHKHIRAASDESGYRTKPSLTVVIPETKLLTKEQTRVALQRPATRDGSMRSVQRETFPTALQREFSARLEAYNKNIERSRTMSRDVSPVEASIHGSSKGTTLFSPLDTSRAGSSSSQRYDPSRSSSNASSVPGKDDNSTYSKQSSNTSVDTHLLKKMQTSRHKLSASAAFSIVNPTVQSAIDDFTPTTKKYMDKPLPLPPAQRSQQSRALPLVPLTAPPLPPVMEGNTPLTPKRPQTARGIKSSKSGFLHQTNSLQSGPSALRHTQSMNKFDVFDKEFMKTSPYTAAEEELIAESPTLSQAEALLHEHLDRISQVPEMPSIKNAGLGIHNLSPPAASSVVEHNDGTESVQIVMRAPSRAPTIPKKSRRRDWRSSESFGSIGAVKPVIRRRTGPSNMQSPACDDAPPADWWMTNRLSRSVSTASLPKLHGLADFIARDNNEKLVCGPVVDDGLIVVSGPTIMHRRQRSSPPATQEAAEGVLVQILASLTSINDLMNAMRINKGMYRVFRENKQALVETVAQNESPPAAELREWLRPSRNSPDGSEDEAEDFVEQSVASYVQAWRHDLDIIEKLKIIIICECQSIIRKETVAAMANAAHSEAQRITDAFWRIWAFCAIFGSQKGRDEDLTGQLDWLKGGRLANNLDCAATVSSSAFDFDVGSILLNAPEYFGKGNGSGLTADQLYDVTEVWTCMATLLQGYLGRVDQAREFGVYDNCDIDPEDIDKEEYMIEEWIAFILTLGPTVVLELAEYATDRTSAGFALAKQNGWTRWKPPIHTASRVTFLKEPVARLYEERVTMAHAKATDAREQAQKLESRRRIAAHALEIRMRRQDSKFKRVPLVDMSMERPMSIMSTFSANPALTPRFPPKDGMTLPPLPAPIHPALRAEAAISPNSAATIQEALRSPPLRTSPMPASLSPRMIPPIAMTQHQARNPQREALRAFNGVGSGTVELAIERIVAMGFTDVEAKHALRTTDGGDGLRVDRAVEYLLRSRTPPT